MHPIIIRCSLTLAFANNSRFDAVDLDPPLDSRSASLYEVWHCEECVPYHGPGRMRHRRSGLRKRKRINFVKLNDPGIFLEGGSGGGGQRGGVGVAANDIQDVDFGSMIRQRKNRGAFKVASEGDAGGCLLRPRDGEPFDEAYVRRHGFFRPVLFATETPSELGLRLPSSDDVGGEGFTYRHVASLVGPFRTIQVIDTATQLTTEYTLQEWVEYLETPPGERTRTLNVITLEFSQTRLGGLVTEPQFARDVDFVNLHWPDSLEGVGGGSSPDATTNAGVERTAEELSGDILSQLEELKDQLDELRRERPRVSKYCLMSASGSYTDFHVDFGGTAVWYHVYFGSKIFYFVEPTQKNLRIFAKWATSASRGPKYEFLPDLIVAAGGTVHEVSLRRGQTLFIPSGWIHAVYTPCDSLVFGGNFVHRHSLEMQLAIYRLERRMKVGKDYRFPNYQKLMWYAARDFLEECNKLLRMGDSFAYDTCDDDERRRARQVLCGAYPAHVIRGYNSLAKELGRWSVSKLKHTTDQYPSNMNVAAISSKLGDMMRLCVSHFNNGEEK